MRIPPQVLCNPGFAVLEFSGTRRVCASDLKSVVRDVTSLDAFVMSARGEIEAICTASGRLKYFRLLSECQKPEVRPSVEPTNRSSGIRLGSAIQAYYEEQIGDSLVGTLGKARHACVKRSDWSPTAPNCQIVRWSDRDGFNPYRFN